MDADAGIFVEDALQTGFADAAEAGDFGDGGLTVDTAVQKIYGPAEKNGVRIAGGRGNGSGFGKGEHEKLQVRSSSLGIDGQPAEGLQVAAVAVRVSGALPGEGVQSSRSFCWESVSANTFSPSQAVSGPSAAKEKIKRSAPFSPVTMNL